MVTKISEVLTPLKQLLVLSTLIFISFNIHSQEVDLDNIQKLYKEGEYKDAVAQLDKVGVENFSPTHFELYIYSLANIDLDEAEEAADKAIQTHDTDPDMYLIHADIMGRQAQSSIFSALGYAKKAKTSLETAAKLAPSEPKYLQGLMTFYLAAPSIAGGDTDQALAQAKAIAELDEELGYSAIASYHWAVEEKTVALENLQKGLLKYPNSFSLLNQKANFYLSDEKYNDAIATYKNITQLDLETFSPDDTQNSDVLDEYEDKQSTVLNSHYQIGRVSLVGETQYQLGIEHMQKYIELYSVADFNLDGLPSLDWANLRLAGLLLENGDTKLAQATIKQVQNPKIDNMESIYKKLNKKINRAMKKLG